MQNGSMKAKISKLHASLIDTVASEIIIKDGDRVVAQSKSKRPANKLIRIVVRL